MDEKVNKLGHEDLLLDEGSRKGGDAGGIHSLRSGSGRVCCIVENISRPNINAECDHEVDCLVESAAIPINYRSISLCVMGERGYDAEELLNLTDTCEHLPRRLNSRENYHIHLTKVVPGD